jgi:ParB family chromosome partitioning protein
MDHSLTGNACNIVLADPFRCRGWPLYVRAKEGIIETSCQAEIESIRRDGQLVPAIGRQIPDDPDFDIEVVCGIRRLFIARLLKTPFRVEIRQLSDRQAAATVEGESALRKQPSPYERGLWLAKLLKQNLYRSREEMSRDLGVTLTHVTRLLAFAELPEPVVCAFASPNDILESWAVELQKAAVDERRNLLIERARTIKKREPRPPAIIVYEILMSTRAAGRVSRGVISRVVKSPTGIPLLRFERQRSETVLRIPNCLVNSGVEEAVTQAVATLLTQLANASASAA